MLLLQVVRLWLQNALSPIVCSTSGDLGQGVARRAGHKPGDLRQPKTLVVAGVHHFCFFL